MQLSHAPSMQPSIKRNSKAEHGNQRDHNWDHEEHDTIEKGRKPKRRIPLPESGARAVKCLCRRGEGQIIWLLGRKFTDAIEGAWRPVDFTHRFQQQVLQGWVQVLAYKDSVSQSNQVDIRARNVATQADKTPP